MAIELQCSECGRKLRVAEKFAGRRAKCPGCQAEIAIPASPAAAPTVSALPPPVITPSGSSGARVPSAKLVPPEIDEWYLRTDDGQEYGPVPKSELDYWVEEGRVDATCEVRREDWSTWQPAHEAYPQLAPPPSFPEEPPVAPAMDARGAPPLAIHEDAVSPLGARAPARQTRQYPGLSIAAAIYAVLAWIVAGIGVMAAIIVAIVGILVLVEGENLLLGVGLLIGGELLIGLIFFLHWLTLKVVAEFIELMLHLAADSQQTAAATNRMVELLAERKK